MFTWGRQGSIGDGRLDPPDEVEPIEDRETCETCKREYTVYYFEDSNGRKDYTKDSGHCEFHYRVMCVWCDPNHATAYKPCSEEDDGKISDGMCEKAAKLWISQMDEGTSK